MPDTSANALWTVELMGGLAAVRGGERTTRFATQKTASLLAFLAFYRDKAHPREALIELLWPGGEPEAGRSRLSTLLSFLRRLLEPPDVAPGTVVLAGRITVQLNPAAITTDAAEFERLLLAAKASDPAQRLFLLQRAVALHQGELLPGRYDEWVLQEQPRLGELCITAWQNLAAAWEAAGEWEHALDAAEHAIRADPYREEAHRCRLRLLAALERPAAVEEGYRQMERLFREDLGTTPSAETRFLVERLRREPVPARPIPLREVSPPEPAAPALPPAAVAATPGRLPSTVPLQLTRFFGREAEVAELCRLFQDTPARLVTLTGVGGAGKTRLAAEALSALAGAYAGRVWFVPLADLPDARLLPGALARTLGLPPAGGGDPLDAVAALLDAGPSLLALDNFEHLLRDDAEAAPGEAGTRDNASALVRLLLERAPALRCLVTSRRPLHLGGEQEMPVPPLPVPASFSAADVLGSASAALYADRARLARPDFAVTDHNAASVARLCRRLEGSPLALEMAAAWAKALTPARMLERLEERLDALTSRRRDGPARHRSLRATLDWSWDLLDAPQRRLLARLSVFRGGWTLEAVESVCAEAESSAAAPPGRDVLGILSDLVDRSLVVCEEQSGESRYRLLETVRRYAQDHLSASGEAADAQARHAAFFLETARTFSEQVAGDRGTFWLDALEAEQENLRVALSASAPEPRLELAWRLYPFWDRRGHWREGSALLREALARDLAAEKSPIRIRALFGAGVLASNLGRHTEAGDYVQEVLAVSRERGDRRGIAYAAMMLGNLARDAQDFPAAHGWYAEGLETARALGEDSLIASTLTNLGALAVQENQTEAGLRFQQECLLLARRTGNRYTEARSHQIIAALHLQEGRWEAAGAAVAECFLLLRSVGDPRLFFDALRTLARAEVMQGRAACAVTLWGAVQRHQQEIGSEFDAEVQERLTKAREELGNPAFTAAYAQGQRMERSEALEHALQIAGSR